MQTGLPRLLRTVYGTHRSEPSFLFSYWISNSPDGDQIVGLEMEHFFDLTMRVGHPVLGANLLGDVIDL